MDSESYVRRLLSAETVPACCQCPMILGPAFEIDDYSNLTHETEIRHKVATESFDAKPKCTFRFSPLALAMSGVCPICGETEFTALNDQWRMREIAKEMYRDVVNEFSEWAMYQYVFPEFYLIRGTNKRRLHLDHIFPVSLGFTESVPEFVIGSPINCRWTTAKKNLNKGDTPHQTLEQLITRFEEFIASFPEWQSVKNHYFRTGGIEGSPKPVAKFRETELAKQLIDEEASELIKQVVTEAEEARLQNKKKKSSRGIIVEWRTDFRNGKNNHAPPDDNE